jgi:hypothetical protein
VTAISQRLQDISGPDCYRRNAFRVTGLETVADRRTIRASRQKLTTAATFGSYQQRDWEWALPTAPTTDQLRVAFDTLGDSQHRIIEEIFWFWGPDSSCGCPTTLHDAHDAAVAAHARVLDQEWIGGTPHQRWEEAANCWSALLRRAAFWSHVRHRMTALDDRRLTEDTIDALRDELPRALVTPIVELALKADDPRRLVGLARHWKVGEHVVDDLIAETVSQRLATLESDLNRARRQLDGGQLGAAANDLLTTTVPGLRRVEQFASYEEHRGVARTREQIAVLLNNCALAMTRVRGNAQPGRILELFELAKDLAVEADTRQTVKDNLVLRQLTDRLGKTRQPAFGKVGSFLAGATPFSVGGALGFLANGGGPGFWILGLLALSGVGVGCVRLWARWTR